MNVCGSINECCTYLKSSDFPDDVKSELLNNLNSCISMLDDSMLIGLPIRDVIFTLLDYISVDISEEQNVIALRCMCNFIRIHSVACDVAMLHSSLVEKVSQHLKQIVYFDIVESCVSVLYYGSLRHPRVLLQHGLTPQQCGVHEFVNLAVRKQLIQLVLNMAECPSICSKELKEIVTYAIPMVSMYAKEEESIYSQLESQCVVGAGLQSSTCRQAALHCIKHYIQKLQGDKIVGILQKQTKDEAFYNEELLTLLYDVSAEPLLPPQNDVLGFLPWQADALQRVNEQIGSDFLLLPCLPKLQFALYSKNTSMALELQCMCLSKKERVPLSMLDSMISLLEENQPSNDMESSKNMEWTAILFQFLNTLAYTCKEYSLVYTTPQYTVYSYITTQATTDLYYISSPQEISLPGIYIILHPVSVDIHTSPNSNLVQLKINTNPSIGLSPTILHGYHSHAQLFHIHSLLEDQHATKTTAKVKDSFIIWKEYVASLSKYKIIQVKRVFQLLLYILQGVEFDLEDIHTYITTGVISMIVTRTMSQVQCALSMSNLSKPLSLLLEICPRDELTRCFLHVFFQFPELAYNTDHNKLPFFLQQFIQACNKQYNLPTYLLVQHVVQSAVHQNNVKNITQHNGKHSKHTNQIHYSIKVMEWVYSIQDIPSVYTPALSVLSNNMDNHGNNSNMTDISNNMGKDDNCNVYINTTITHPYITGEALPLCFSSDQYIHKYTEQAFQSFFHKHNPDFEHFVAFLRLYPWIVSLSIRKQYIEKTCLGDIQTAFAESIRPACQTYSDGIYNRDGHSTHLLSIYYCSSDTSRTVDLIHRLSPSQKHVQVELQREHLLKAFETHANTQCKTLRLSFAGESGFGSGPTTAGFLALSEALNKQQLDFDKHDPQTYSILGYLTAYALLENKCFPIFQSVHFLDAIQLSLQANHTPLQKSVEIATHHIYSQLANTGYTCVHAQQYQAAQYSRLSKKNTTVYQDNINQNELYLMISDTTLTNENLRELNYAKEYEFSLVDAFLTSFTRILHHDQFCFLSSRELLSIQHKKDYFAAIQKATNALTYSQLDETSHFSVQLPSSLYTLDLSELQFTVEHFSLKAPFTADSPTIQFQLEFLNHKATSEQKAQFISFITAMNINEYMNTLPTIYISKIDSKNTNTLPISSTCTKTLKLSQYTDAALFEKHITRILAESLFLLS